MGCPSTHSDTNGHECTVRPSKKIKSRQLVSLTKLKKLWSSYGAGRHNRVLLNVLGSEENLLQGIEENDAHCFNDSFRVARALGRNNELGFELFEKRPKRGPMQIDDNGDPHPIESGYRGMILVETLCRLAFIADPCEISRITIKNASEMGGLPVCAPYLLPKAGMPNVADADDKAYAAFVDTLVAETHELVETHATDRQKEQICRLYHCSAQTTAEVCKAALAAAVAAYHEEADTDHCYLTREANEAGMWADGNLPT
jgi:hypothetical protein